MRRVDNPKNRFERTELVWEDEQPPHAGLELHEEHAKSILSENDSPDIGFRFSLNPYRGCYHGCAYCYARPSHQYWGFGAGTDFERKIILKVNAPELLRERFERRDWQGELIVFSGNTDCYQPLEAAHKLTRRCLEVCAEYKNPVSIITKNALVARDIDVLMQLHERAAVRVYVSIPFSDPAHARGLEPGASPPHKRFAALQALAEHGIETGISISPVIVGLNDGQLPGLLKRARDVGVKHAFATALRLPGEVASVFEGRLRELLPGYADKVLSGIHQIRGGKLNNSNFGERMTGIGPRWKVISDLFEMHCKRLGIQTTRTGMDAREANTFERPTQQLELF
ncbi:MAG TPA: PA0069 family radical SAM protein [Polyangiales bacterium]|nr:PA0069 family radical SAM protein [Polyangiales bacterium]